MNNKKNKKELKHIILDLLYTDKNKDFALVEIEKELNIDFDRILSLSDEMNNEDMTADLKNWSSLQGDDYHLKINPKGIGYYLDEEYLKEEKPLPTSIKLNQQFINKNFGYANQDSDFSESEESQSVTTTPKINESNAIKIPWYKATLFKYVIYPLLVIIITWLIISLIKGKLQLPT